MVCSGRPGSIYGAMGLRASSVVKGAVVRGNRGLLPSSTRVRVLLFLSSLPRTHTPATSNPAIRWWPGQEGQLREEGPCTRDASIGGDPPPQRKLGRRQVGSSISR